VAHVIGKAEAQKRQRHPAAFASFAHKQQHPAAARAVVDVALAGGGGFPGEALALPVERLRGDGVVVLGLLEGDEEDVALGCPIEQHSRLAGGLLDVRDQAVAEGCCEAVGGVRPEAGYGGFLGRIRGSFSLSNPTRPDLAPLEVSALADSGAVHLCIPEHLAIQLSLAGLERREVVLGAIPMEDMDLVLRRQLQSVDVNPESPNIPLSVAK
jgi:hypothetical protein